ncbi:DUF6318 family protein [Isoptericola jiangsuensis]|uniref:DUF6318 family protein n=1 Tax=Isoptericola jiangsuensis TaxID=548579 RepID=UPI003AAC3116
MPRPRTALCALGAAILLLAGCTTPAPPDATGQSPAPDATASSEPAPAPSSSRSEADPVIVAPPRPAAMDDDGYEGASAAAEYFIELDDYIMKTNDTAEWEAMSHEKCSTCAARLEQAQTIADSAYTYTGGDSEVRVDHVYEQDSATRIWPVDVYSSVEPASLVDANGAEVQSLEAVSAMNRVEVVRDNGRWTIVGITGLDQ